MTESKQNVVLVFYGAINQELTVPVGTKLSDVPLGVNLENYVLRNKKNGYMISASKYVVEADVGITTKDKADVKAAKAAKDTSAAKTEEASKSEPAAETSTAPTEEASKSEPAAETNPAPEATPKVEIGVAAKARRG